MDQIRSLPRLCFVLTAALSGLGAILGSICMLCCFEADVGYLTPGFLPTLSRALYAVALFLAILCAVRIPKNTLPARLHTPGRAPLAVLMVIALAVFAVVALLTLPAKRENNVILAAALLAIPAAAYFLISAACTDSRYPDWLSLLGFFPVAWSIAGVGETYFDRYVTMNSPVKTAIQIGLLGFMVILLAELRFRVGSVLPRYSLAFWSVGSYTCLVGGLPPLCGYLRDRIIDAEQSSVPDKYALYAVVLLCAGLYGLFTLFRYTRSTSVIPASPAQSSAPAEDATPDTPTTAE